MSVWIYVEVVRYVNSSLWSKFLWPTLWRDSLFAPTRLYVEIVLYIKSFYRHLGFYFLLVPALIVLERKIQARIPFGDSLRGFHFAFAGTSELLPLGSFWEFSRRRLGTNSFWCPFRSLLLFAIPGDSFLGIPPCFPPLGFILIVLFARNSVFSRRGFTVLLLSWGTPYITCYLILFFHNISIHYYN